MPQLKELKDRPRTSYQQSSLNVGVIIVPGVVGVTLDEQTCSHFQELMKRWCEAPYVWTYDHGVEPHAQEFWSAYCAAGKDLLARMLVLVEQKPDVDLVLIGHRLGAFILKQALIHADREKGKKLPKKLFEALRTLIMIGDPYLDNKNRTDWASLVQDCLPPIKGTTPDTFSETALSCLKFIEETFEQVTIQSQFFQVHGRHPARSKILRPFESLTKQRNCVCDGNVTVRMWITNDADELVPSGTGKKSGCIFRDKGAFHQPLRLITCGEYWPDGCKPLPSSEEQCSTSPSSTTVEEEGADPGVKDLNGCHTKSPSTSSSLHQYTTTTDLSEEQMGNADVQQHSHGACESSSNGHSNQQDGKDCRSEDTRSGTAQLSGSDLLGMPANLGSRHASPSEECSHSKAFGNCVPTMDSLEDSAADDGQDSLQSNANEVYELDILSLPAEEGREADMPARIRSRPLPLRLSLPPPCEPFVGRTDTLNWLERIFFPSSSENSAQELTTQKPTIAVLSGVAGIGKTQIARRFAQQAASRFDAVFWIQAEDKSTTARSFHEIAVALRLVNGRREQNHERSSALCLDWFATSENSWLLIFDDVESTETVYPYLPRNNRGSIIISTRQRSLEFPNATRPIYVDVKPFSETEGLELLQRSTSLTPAALASSSAGQLMRSVSFRPLDLSWVAGYLQSNKLRDIPDNFIERLSPNPKADVSSHGATVSAVFSVAVRSLSVDARRILALLSYLDPENTRESFIAAVSERFPSLSGDPDQAEERFETALQELKVRQFVENVEDGDRVQVHRQLQDHMRNSMRADEKRETLKDIISLLTTQWPSRKKFRNCLHGFWPEFDDVIDTCRRVFVIMDGLDDCHSLSIMDVEYTRILLLSLWYDCRVRGNRPDDLGALDFVHSIQTLPIQVSSTQTPPIEGTSNTSPKPRTSSRMPRRLVFINHRRQECQLIETQGKQYAYLAISFGFEELDSGPKLMRSTLDNLRAGVSMRRMPKLVKDSSTFCAMLAVDYIWIDDLCILQEDDNERVSEIFDLDNTYRCALSTIAPLTRARRRFQQREVNWGPYSLKCGAAATFSRFSACKELYRNPCKELYRDQLTRDFTSIDLWITLPPVIYGDLKSCGEVNTYAAQMDTANVAPDYPTSESDTSTKPSSTASPPSELPSDLKSTGVVAQQSDIPNDRDTLHVVELAVSCIEEGVECYKRKSPIRAIAKFVQARDSIFGLAAPSHDAMQAHLRASTYLAFMFLKDTCTQAASDMLSTSENLVLKSGGQWEDILPVVAQFRLTKGDVLQASGMTVEATTTYRKVAELSDKNGYDIADLVAIAKLRLSDLALTGNDLKDAQRLVKETVAHFEEQESGRGQSQYARALYHQALVYAASGKEKLRKRSVAAARQALEEVCEECSLPIPQTEKELEKSDFEAILELGFV